MKIYYFNTEKIYNNMNMKINQLIHFRTIVYVVYLVMVNIVQNTVLLLHSVLLSIQFLIKILKKSSLFHV